jgi:hypothetical protein
MLPEFVFLQRIDRRIRCNYFFNARAVNDYCRGRRPYQERCQEQDCEVEPWCWEIPITKTSQLLPRRWVTPALQNCPTLSHNKSTAWTHGNVVKKQISSAPYGRPSPRRAQFQNRPIGSYNYVAPGHPCKILIRSTRLALPSLTVISGCQYDSAPALEPARHRLRI